MNRYTYVINKMILKYVIYSYFVKNRTQLTLFSTVLKTDKTKISYPHMWKHMGQQSFMWGIYTVFLCFHHWKSVSSTFHIHNCNLEVHLNAMWETHNYSNSNMTWMQHNSFAFDCSYTEYTKKVDHDHKSLFVGNNCVCNCILVTSSINITTICSLLM